MFSSQRAKVPKFQLARNLPGTLELGESPKVPARQEQSRDFGTLGKFQSSGSPELWNFGPELRNFPKVPKFQELWNFRTLAGNFGKVPKFQSSGGWVGASWRSSELWNFGTLALWSLELWNFGTLTSPESQSSAGPELWNFGLELWNFGPSA